VEKFHGLVGPALGEDGWPRLLEACLNLERAEDASAIVALSR
jgi:hypothetical protein